MTPSTLLGESTSIIPRSCDWWATSRVSRCWTWLAVEGFYSREFVRRGATRVVGVDSSPAMISLARTTERAEPLGVEYVVADVQELEDREQFDLVVAAFLLNYASSAGELRNMSSGCRAPPEAWLPVCHRQRQSRSSGRSRLTTESTALRDWCPPISPTARRTSSATTRAIRLIRHHGLPPRCRDPRAGTRSGGADRPPMGPAAGFRSGKDELRLRILGDVPSRSPDHPARVPCSGVGGAVVRERRRRRTVDGAIGPLPSLAFSVPQTQKRPSLPADTQPPAKPPRRPHLRLAGQELAGSLSPLDNAVSAAFTTADVCTSMIVSDLAEDASCGQPHGGWPLRVSVCAARMPTRRGWPGWPPVRQRSRFRHRCRGGGSQVGLDDLAGLREF